MMTRTQAFEYMKEHYYVDEMDNKTFKRTMKTLMTTPHKPWCRKQLAPIFPNYGSDCTCDEG